MSNQADMIEKFVGIGTKLIPNISAMEEMIKNGSIPHVNVVNKECGDFTALMIQTRWGSEAAMEWLLTQSPPADVNLQSINGYFALMWAVIVDDVNKVCLLLEYGADRNMRDKQGRTPLDVAKNSTVFHILESYHPKIRSHAVLGLLEADIVAAQKNEENEAECDPIFDQIANQEINRIEETDCGGTIKKEVDSSTSMSLKDTVAKIKNIKQKPEIVINMGVKKRGEWR
jgi:ankyrin repeat protein